MWEHLDFWAMIATLLALAYFTLRDRIVRPIKRAFGGRTDTAPAKPSARPTRRRVPIRRVDGKLNGSFSMDETRPKTGEVISFPVSPIAVPKDDPEMIAFRFLARLIHVGTLTETQALETACGVKAGSSKAYQDARAKLKRALEEMIANQVEAV